MSELHDKRILFVEDRAHTVRVYRDELLRLKAVTQLAENMGDAVDKLESQKKFDLLLIDLNIPPLPESLMEYGRKLRKLELNEGQALGMWLDDRHPDLPYAYLTAVPVVLDAQLGWRQKYIKLISKTNDVEDFIKKISTVMDGWSNTPKKEQNQSPSVAPV